MANVLRGYRPKKNQINFRYLRSTEPETLERWGYYRGFPCAFGHTIRDSTNHWCYECVLKISCAREYSSECAPCRSPMRIVCHTFSKVISMY